MGKTLAELAKSAILNLTVKDARVERFTARTYFGFGMELRATRAGFEAFVVAVEGLGLDPMMNRWIQVSDAEPAEWIYEIFVEIPGGWKPQTD